MNLWFSIYTTDDWKFGKDGLYFCIGPLRFTNRTFLEITNNKTKTSVLEHVVDYEADFTYKRDKYVLYLQDGSKVERIFGRTYKEEWDEITQEKVSYGKQTPSSQNFLISLRKRCGY